MKIWYVVADGARARFFQSIGWDGEFEQFDHFINENGRLMNRDFGRDAPGRSFKGGSRRTSMEERESPKQRDERKFAKRIGERLNEAFQNNEFDRLILVAAPKALGNIRETLSKKVKGVVEGTSSKNYTKSPLEEIEKHIETKFA